MHCFELQSHDFFFMYVTYAAKTSIFRCLAKSLLILVEKAPWIICFYMQVCLWYWYILIATLFQQYLWDSCNICFGHWVILRALNDIKQFFFFKSSKPRTFLSRLSRNQFTKFWCCKTYFTFNWKSSSTKFSFFWKNMQKTRQDIKINFSIDICLSYLSVQTKCNKRIGLIVPCYFIKYSLVSSCCMVSEMKCCYLSSTKTRSKSYIFIVLNMQS